MATLADLRARIKTFMSRSDLINADLDWAVNKVHGRDGIQHEITTWYQRKISTFATVVGTKSYAVPTDYRELLAPLWYNDGSTRTIMAPADPTTHAFLNPLDTDQGPPTRYQIVNGAFFYIDPTPDRIVTINRWYNAILPDLVLTTDSDRITDEFELGLVFGAARLLSLQLGDKDGAKSFQEMYNEQRATLNRTHVYQDEGGNTIDLPLRGVM